MRASDPIVMDASYVIERHALCVWCKRPSRSFAYRGERGVNLCDSHMDESIAQEFLL